MMSALVGVIVSLLVIVAPASAGTEPCEEGCVPLGSLSVALSSIEPGAPVVGDMVTFTFDLDARLPGGVSCGAGFSGSCTFVGGGPVLDGDEPPTDEASGIVVRRRAAQVGVATVRLEVRGESEEACTFEDEFGCHTISQPAFVEASSGPIEVNVVEAPTPTPTVTPTPRSSTDDDGCAIGGSRHAGIGTVSLLLPIILLVSIRRTHRQHRSFPVVSIRIGAT